MTLSPRPPWRRLDAQSLRDGEVENGDRGDEREHIDEHMRNHVGLPWSVAFAALVRLWARTDGKSVTGVTQPQRGTG
jgi:hypothetical protein